MMAGWRSRHFTAVAALGPQEAELEHSKVVVSWLLSFHVLFMIPPEHSTYRVKGNFYITVIIFPGINFGIALHCLYPQISFG